MMEKEINTGFSWKNLTENDLWEDPSVDKMIILKLIL
jgi:hypothetical protein